MGKAVYVPKTPLSASEPEFERAAVEGNGISWDFVNGSGLNGHSQEPGKMMVEPSRAGEQTGPSDLIGV